MRESFKILPILLKGRRDGRHTVMFPLIIWQRHHVFLPIARLAVDGSDLERALMAIVD